MFRRRHPLWPEGYCPAAKAAGAAAKKANVGYNVQTAVGQTSDAGIPVWLMALTGDSPRERQWCSGRADGAPGTREG